MMNDGGEGLMAEKKTLPCRMAMLVDTHTHLYLDDFDADRPLLLQQAAAAKVERFYLPNIDDSSIEAMLKLEAAHPQNCFAMMGLHPCSVQANYIEQLHTIERWLEKRTFVGIGEIGLDFYWDTTYAKEQQIAFEMQIEMAMQAGIPIVIHSREAMDACIDTVERFQNGNLSGIFHCFGGTLEQAKRIIDLGFLLGIGGVITYRKSGLAAVVKELPGESLVLETDAPYLTPVPHRGKRNEPAYLAIIAQALADACEESLEKTAATTTSNALKLFGS